MNITRRNLFKALAGLCAAALMPKMEAAEAIGPNGGYLVPEPLASRLMKMHEEQQATIVAENITKMWSRRWQAPLSKMTWIISQDVGEQIIASGVLA